MKTVLVCGGRDFTDTDLMFTNLDSLSSEKIRVVNGGAKGADTLSTAWAIESDCPYKEYPAEWDKYGLKAAGPIRNQQMLDEEKIDMVIAFPTPKSKGTWDMVQRAKKEGIPVIVVR